MYALVILLLIFYYFLKKKIVTKSPPLLFKSATEKSRPKVWWTRHKADSGSAFGFCYSVRLRLIEIVRNELQVNSGDVSVYQVNRVIIRTSDYQNWYSLTQKKYENRFFFIRNFSSPDRKIHSIFTFRLSNQWAWYLFILHLGDNGILVFMLHVVHCSGQLTSQSFV